MKTLFFFSYVDCACAECESLEAAVHKSGFAHDFEHFVALCHSRDAFGQVTVSAIVF